MCARRPSAVHTANKAANLRGKQLCFANCAALVNTEWHYHNKYKGIYELLNLIIKNLNCSLNAVSVLLLVFIKLHF